MVEAQLSASGLAPLRTASDLGYEVHFLTNDRDRYAGIGTYQRILDDCVSQVIIGDTNSTAGIISGVASISGRGALAGLYTHCDYNLPLVAAAARELGLPGLDPAAAAIARNKLATRTVCAQAGVPAPRHRHATTLEQAVAAGREFGFPCVVKPMTESASTGVRKALTADDVVDQFAVLTASDVDARGQRRQPGVLVEEYAVGYEVSVETVTYQGHTVVLGVTDKRLSPAPYFAELGDTFPSALPDPVTAAASGTALAALNAIGFDFGAAHTEVKMTVDGPRLIEVNARIGGAAIADLVELATGIRYREQIIRMHLGESPDLRATRSLGAAARYVGPHREGKVRRVHGEEEARRVAGVVEVSVHAHQDDVVVLPTSNHELYGHVVAYADTAAEAGARADAAAGQLHLELVEG